MPNQEWCYVAKQGDTLEGISLRFYGDQRYAMTIWSHNQTPAVKLRRGGPLNAIAPGVQVYMPWAKGAPGGVPSAAASPVSARVQAPPPIRSARPELPEQARRVAAAGAPSGLPSAAGPGAIQLQRRPRVASDMVPSAAPLPVPRLPAPPPEIVNLTPEMIRSGVALPADFQEFTRRVLGIDASVIAKLQTAAKDAKDLENEYADASRGLCHLYKAHQAAKASHYKDTFTHLMAGVGSVWTFLPKPCKSACTEVMAKMMGAVPMLGRMETILKDAEEIDAVGDLLLMVHGMLMGDSKQFDAGGDSLMKKLKAHPGTAVSMTTDLLGLLLDFLPPDVKDELMFKSVGRKIPVVGTVVVGIMDIWGAVTHPSDWKKWAAVGSTAAGVVPGAGTAVSTVVDVGIVIGSVAETIVKVATFTVDPAKMGVVTQAVSAQAAAHARARA